MELNERYADIIKRYPEYITQKQMIEICGVCAKTAYNLERRGVIPYTVEVTPTGRIHRIKLLDVIAYLHQKGNLYCEDQRVNDDLYQFFKIEMLKWGYLIYWLKEWLAPIFRICTSCHDQTKRCGRLWRVCRLTNFLNMNGKTPQNTSAALVAQARKKREKRYWNVGETGQPCEAALFIFLTFCHNKPLLFFLP